MSELKTQKNNKSVSKYLNSIENPEQKKDSKELLKIFKEITKEKPTMWGDSIVGFGSYHYKSERSKQEGDWMKTAFSARKQNLTLYIMPGFDFKKDLLKKLGPHKTGSSCLYIKRLSDINLPTLKQIIKTGWKEMRKR